MFDCLEETHSGKEWFYLVRTYKNKRGGMLYLSSVIPLLGQLRWSSDLKDARKIFIRTADYEIIKSIVRDRKVRCQIMWMNEEPKPKPKSVRKETWWDRIKVWFSRKVQYFAGYISIEKPID